MPSNSTCLDEVIGLISFGLACGTAQPNANTRVSSYVIEGDGSSKVIVEVVKPIDIVTPLANRTFVKSKSTISHF